jgi:serine/threonine protein kinase
MAAKEAIAGETIGNYDLVEKLAEGSMGKVYKARHWQTNQIVAIKVMSPEIARNPVFLKRFEQEFRIASKLDHPNIVKVIEYCGGEAPFFVMEYVDGESLGEKLERGGPLNEEDALRIIVQIAEGLGQAHRQGMIHRDIKPDNILVTADGQAKLTDLGLAKQEDAAIDLTRTGRGLGTPTFMAPEQFRNAKNASVRCDVYSLGATLYQMVTGQLPFTVADPVASMMRKMQNDFPAPRNVVPTISLRIDQAIRRSMSADPGQRPVSCQEFVDDVTGQRIIPEAAAAESSLPPGERLASEPDQNATTPPASTVPPPVEAAPSAPPAPPKAEAAPHFQFTTGSPKSAGRYTDLLKSVLIVVLTVIVTLLAAKYILPLLPLGSK